VADSVTTSLRAVTAGHCPLLVSYRRGHYFARKPRRERAV